MSKTLSSRILKGSAATAIAVAVSLAATAPGSAATYRTLHGHVRAQQADPPPTYYNYVPGQSDYTRGQLGLRTNPTIVPPGAYGPPDPASCGGFHC